MEFIIKVLFFLILLSLVGCFNDEKGNNADNNNITKPGKIIQDCENCQIMRFIPKGEFVMGAITNDQNALNNEKPQRDVEIINNFFIGLFEVTYYDYIFCVRDGGCTEKPQNIFAECMSDDQCRSVYKNRSFLATLFPVTDITYDSAEEYVNWLSKKTKHIYRLPTEEEWEYAARSGTNSIYWWGNDIGQRHIICSGCSGISFAQVPLYIDMFGGNPFGVVGMLGNAKEMVDGCYESDCLFHTYKGGWEKPMYRSRISKRTSFKANEKFSDLGFRIVREYSLNDIKIFNKSLEKVNEGFTEETTVIFHPLSEPSKNP